MFRNLASRSLLATLLILALSCTRAPDDVVAPPPANSKEIQSVALAKRDPVDSGTLFESLPGEKTGIDFVHKWHPSQKYEFLLDNALAGGGVCTGDYDGDGLPDVFLTRSYGGNQLYRNLGGFKFENVSEKSGIDKTAWGLGASFADVDGDADLDIYVCGYDCPNQLYINQGDGTFTEQAKQSGVDFVGASVMMAFADYDLDGDLDGYLVTNRYSLGTRSRTFKVSDGKTDFSDDGPELTDIVVRRDGSRFQRRAGQFDHFYQNNGDGTFTEVTEQAGMAGQNFFGLSATWWDHDDDGLPDLYVANDFYGPDHFYRNNGDGTFTDISKVAIPHTPWFSMGADVADINNDGMLDFMGSDMAGTSHYKQKLSMGDMETVGWFLTHPTPRQYMKNAVYLNSGASVPGSGALASGREVIRFLEVAKLTGLGNTDWTWSLKFGDLDNDGWIDLYVTNGMTRDWFNSDMRGKEGKIDSAEYWNMFLESPKRDESNVAFKNLGDLKFKHIEKDWGLDHIGISFGAAMADLDGDGDLDIVVNNFEGPATVYRNQSSSGHRIKIRLEGKASNRHGVGAMLRVETKSGKQMRYLTLSRGFMSANDPVEQFGLGQDDRILKLSVRWPSGHAQVFKNLPADHFYVIKEPSGKAPAYKKPAEPPVMFGAGFGPPHMETPFDDFARQPLLPNQLSKLGPGSAWGDVDGDGDEDLYIGGAAGQPGTLYQNNGSVGIAPFPGLDAFTADQSFEDMAPLFFDADSDGDMDLYVVSGGVECEPEAAVLVDRLYFNNGTGGFTRAPESVLPYAADSGSTVSAADFDRDGDVDLFVGGRSIPGQYPVTPISRLLRNEGGTFADVTETAAPGLSKTGLVTSSIWSDANGDGWVDLLVTHEWDPVKLYSNEQGTLVDRTADAGLSRWTGWWNGIAARDIDNDSDIDYVVTNFGLNTKYHASEKEPTSLYYGDFEGDGGLHVVEACFEDSTLYPVRGKSCSSDAMPYLGDKFPTFSDFAQASLETIYTSGALESAHRLEANTLESGVLINDGGARFTFRPLPRIAQVSPGFGVVLTEVDGDGHPDIYLVQNFHSPQRETGHMDGGVSLLLTGKGDGSFTPVWPKRSGLVVSGDAKGLSTNDLNGDGWADFIVAVNNGPFQAFLNSVGATSKNRTFKVRLAGKAGNPTAVGARISVYRNDSTVQSAEVHAGGSYLSQSSSELIFGLGASARVTHVDVRWPDGQTTRATPQPEARTVTIKAP